MPTLSLFFGILIKMNKEDGNRHNKPHIHAFYQGFEAPFDIETGDVLANADFPKDQTNLVKSWIFIHREDLLANWKLLLSEGQYFKIDPLR